MEKHKCKACNKIFACGRALGGHMRSHLPKFPIPQNTLHLGKSIDRPSEPSTPSGLSMDFSVHDSESYSSQTPLHHRPLDTPPEEDVALCLMMLSRDSWTIPIKFTREEEKEEGEKEIKKLGKLSGYRCSTCNKMFGSYQALGGHRGSHKKMKIQSSAKNDSFHMEIGERSGVDEKVKTYECPCCFKVFDSGQALGGHKKIHPSNSTQAPTLSTTASGSAHKNASSSSRLVPRSCIDLNLPALPDDDDGSGHVAEVSDAAMHYAVIRR